MPDVQEVFRMATQKVRPDPGALERQNRNQRRRVTRQRVGGYALVAALAIAAGVIGITSVRQSDRRPATQPARVEEATLEDRLQAELTVEDAPDWMDIGFGSVWVARVDAAAVDRIDPETNQVVASIEVGEPCKGMVAGYGSLWVPSCEEATVLRIDPETDRVTAQIDVPQVYSPTVVTHPAAGAGGIWMVTAGPSGDFDLLVRIDPGTEQIEDRVRLGHIGNGVAVGEGAVWVASTDDGVVLKVDPIAGRVVDEIDGLEAPRFIAAGEGSVWVLSGTRSDRTPGDGSVTRIDPVTGETLDRIEIDERAGQASDIAVAEGHVWARTQYTLLAAIDPGTNSVVYRLTDQKGFGDVAVGFGSVWLSDSQFNRVWRVAPPS